MDADSYPVRCVNCHRPIPTDEDVLAYEDERRRKPLCSSCFETLESAELSDAASVLDREKLLSGTFDAISDYERRHGVRSSRTSSCPRCKTTSSSASMGVCPSCGHCWVPGRGRR